MGKDVAFPKHFIAHVTFLPSADLDKYLDDCRGFLKRHTSTLSRWPALFVQQALNEPPETSAHIWAAGLEGNRGVRVIECLNSSEGDAPEMR